VCANIGFLYSNGFMAISGIFYGILENWFELFIGEVMYKKNYRMPERCIVIVLDGRG